MENDFPTKAASLYDCRSQKGQETSGEHVPACCQAPVVVPSSGVGLEGSNYRSHSIDSRIHQESELRPRSVDNPPRDWSVPMRAAYNNRPNCNTISSNYEEAFGSVNLFPLKELPAPISEYASAARSLHGNSAPSVNSVTPTNSQAARYDFMDSLKSPTRINSKNTKGKSTRDMTVPMNPEAQENNSRSNSKRKSTSTQLELELDAPPASRIRASANPYPILPEVQPKMRTGINLSIPQPLITILVDSGTKSQRFEVHRSVGMQSPFLHKAFNRSGHLGNHTEQAITLPDVEAPIFGLLINWLYTQKVELAEDRPLQLIEAAKFWTVAGIFFLPALQNKALTLVIMIFIDSDRNEALSPTVEEVKEFCHHAYETHDKTPLKRLAVDQMAGKISAGNVDMWLRALPKGMQEDLTKALVSKLDMVPGHIFESKHIFQYFVPEVEIKEEDKM